MACMGARGRGGADRVPDRGRGTAGRALRTVAHGARRAGEVGPAREDPERRGVRLHIMDSKLLFYYRNRLDGYGLRGAPTLVSGGSRHG